MKSMSELDPKDKIHSIIANKLAEAMKIGKKFDTMILSEEIYETLKQEGLVEIALTTRINSVVIDLLELEYGIQVS